MNDKGVRRSPALFQTEKLLESIFEMQRMSLRGMGTVMNERLEERAVGRCL